MLREHYEEILERLRNEYKIITGVLDIGLADKIKCYEQCNGCKEILGIWFNGKGHNYELKKIMEKSKLRPAKRGMIRDKQEKTLTTNGNSGKKDAGPYRRERFNNVKNVNTWSGE